MSNINTEKSPDRSRIERLWQYLAADPGNVSLLRDLAREGMSTGAFEEAIKALNMLRDINASDANDEAAIIHAMTKLGRFEEAAERGLHAREQWPDDDAVRVELSRALLNARRFDEALMHSEGEYEDPVLAQMAGEFRLQALWHRGDLTAASELAAHLVQQYPDNPRLLAQYSALLYDQERVTEAFDAARHAYAISPDHAYSALHVLASERLLQQDLPGALALLERAQKVRTDDGRIWLIKGSALLMMGQIDDAVVALKHALQIFPGHPGSHLTLAWVYITQRQLDEAEATIHTAIAASPAFAESHGTLAVVLALKGQQEEARQSIRRATLLNKAGFAARYAQSVLDGQPIGSVDKIYKDVMRNMKI